MNKLISLIQTCTAGMYEVFRTVPLFLSNVIFDTA